MGNRRINSIFVLIIISLFYLSFCKISYTVFNASEVVSKDIYRVVRDTVSFERKVEAVKKIFKHILREEPEIGRVALQYVVALGSGMLRGQIAKIVKDRGIDISFKENIGIFDGMEEVRDTLVRIFINKNDSVFIQRSPITDETTRNFRHYGAKVYEFENLDKLQQQLEEADSKKIIYIESNTMKEDNLRKLYEIAEEYNLLIIEDASKVYATDGDYPNVKKLDKSGRVIYFGNVYSVLGEGLQTSYIIASDKIMRKLEWAKGAQTLCPNNLAGVLLAQYLSQKLHINPEADSAETEATSIELEQFLSSVGWELEESEIRRILKMVQKKGVISLGGGMPAPEFFPLEQLAEIIENLTTEEWGLAFSPAPIKGHLMLREALAGWLSKEGRGIKVGAEKVLVTNGSQQGLDVFARMVKEKKGRILTFDPAYLGMLAAAKPIGCDIGKIEDLRDLEKQLESMPEEERTKTYIYVTPTFSNPTGEVMTLGQRKELLRIAKKYGVKILEDDPYGELRYEGERIKSIKALDDEGRGDTVIYFTSNSKVFSPGMRIGYIVASEDIIDEFTDLKEKTVGTSNSLSQILIAKFIQSGQMDEHIQNVLIPEYRKRAEAIKEALEDEIKEHGLEGRISFNDPEGGLFVWVKLPEGIDAEELLEETTKVLKEEDGTIIENGAAFVPGGPFSIETIDGRPSHYNYLRLNFSYVEERNIEEAIFKIMKTVREELDSNPDYN